MAAPLKERAAIGWSGDGHWLAVHDHPGLIRVLERLEHENLREHQVVHVDIAIDSVALSQDAQWLAAGSAGQVVLWRMKPGDAHRRFDQVSRGTLPGPEDAHVELEFAPDASSLAVACGKQVLLLRLDIDALQPQLRVSTLRIGARRDGQRLDFVLDTPASKLTLRKQLRTRLPREAVISLLRPALAVDPESQTSAPAEGLDSALLALRSRLLPPDLGESRAMAAAENALVLDLDSAVADYPWELLLTGHGSAPLGATQGLSRQSREAPIEPMRRAAGEPLHALILSAVGAEDGTAELEHRQATRMATSLQESGEAQGRIEHVSRVTAALAMAAVRETSWRVLIVVGTPNPAGELMTGGGTSIGVRELSAAMQTVPDVIVLLGGDFRRQAERLRAAGVAVCVVAGWPIDTESVGSFFSEFWRALRAREPLVRATQMARHSAFARGRGTAWALEVHGDALWTWPEVPAWKDQPGRARGETETDSKGFTTTSPSDEASYVAHADPPKELPAGQDDWALLMTLSTRWSARVDPTWDRDAQGFAEWLRDPDGGGLPADRVLLSQHETGGWEALRQRLAAVLDAQDDNPSRRLYFVLACAAEQRPSALTLVFGGEEDDVRSTSFDSFESYLRDQINRRRFREIVFVVDTVATELQSTVKRPSLAEQALSVSSSPTSDARYLRLLKHPTRYPGDSLMRQVLAGLTGEAAEEVSGVVTSSSLVEYVHRADASARQLAHPSDERRQLVDALSTGQFALTTTRTKLVSRRRPVVDDRQDEQVRVPPISPPLVRIVYQQAIRLVRTRHPTINLFESLADPAAMSDLYALESLTGSPEREKFEETLSASSPVGKTESSKAVVLSSFTHPDPGASRFSDGSYGVLYVADSLETALAEVSHDLALFLSSTRVPATDIGLRAYAMRVDASVYDMRTPELAESSALRPDDYTASIRLGHELRQRGADGVVYPSVRNKPGALFALFKPSAVSGARAIGEVTLHWDGTSFANPSYRELPGAKKRRVSAGRGRRPSAGRR